MLQAFYNGMSGLSAFAKGLDNVSNNVSNMNTPGFRGNDTFYRSVSGQEGQGLGAGIAGTDVRTKAGETRQTGNETNAAITGAGFFVLESPQGDIYYSRAGQFQIDKDGFLVDAVTEYRVKSMNANGALEDVNIREQRTLAPTATTRVEMNGTLARTGPVESSHQIETVRVFDPSGSVQTLTMQFEIQLVPENSWSVEVRNAEGELLHSGQIAFAMDGTPLDGFNTLTVPLNLEGGTHSVLFDFGTPGSYGQASQVASAPSHSLTANVTDGRAIAGLSSFSFDDQGIIKFAYSNGEKRDGNQLALADFADLGGLIATEKSLYRAPESVRAQYGRPGEQQFGRIQGGYIELSNIDLAQEFGDILIIQRGYQASSRVMTVANELIEQLYNGTRGG